MNRCGQVKAFGKVCGNSAGQRAAGSMGVGIVNAGFAEPCSHTVGIEKIVGVVDIMSTFEQDGTAIDSANVLGYGLNVRFVSDGHTG